MLFGRLLDEYIITGGEKINKNIYLAKEYYANIYTLKHPFLIKTKSSFEIAPKTYN